MQRSIRILTDLPVDVSPQQVNDYVVEALKGWGELFLKPQSPLVGGLLAKTVRINGILFRNDGL